MSSIFKCCARRTATYGGLNSILCTAPCNQGRVDNIRIYNEFIKTVIERARAGSTETFTELSKLEGVSPEKFRDRVARGTWERGETSRAGSRHREGVSTKINVNLGTSGKVVDLD
jgi:hypothetical protein